jgi:hypothetical protein
LQTGTNGFGFVAYDPFTMIASNNVNLGGDFDTPVIYTTAAYTPTNYVNWRNGSNIAVGCAGANSNSLFVQDDLTAPGCHVRLVSAGIKVRYVGSDFRNQGSVYIFRSSGVVRPDLPLDIPTMTSVPTTVVLPVRRSEEYTYYVPDTPVLLGYSTFSTNYLPSGAGIDRHALIIAISGGDPQVPQAWQWDAIANFEVIGGRFPPTPSEGDSVGFAAALSSVPTNNPTTTPKGVLHEAWNNFANSFAEKTTYIAGTVGSGLATGIANMGTAYVASQLNSNSRRLTLT